MLTASSMLQLALGKAFCKNFCRHFSQSFLYTYNSLPPFTPSHKSHSHGNKSAKSRHAYTIHMIDSGEGFCYPKDNWYVFRTCKTYYSFSFGHCFVRSIRVEVFFFSSFSTPNRLLMRFYPSPCTLSFCSCVGSREPMESPL